MLYIFVCALFFSVILFIIENSNSKSKKDISYTDYLFSSMSALTGTGLLAVDLSEVRIGSQIVVLIMIQCGSTVMLSLCPVVIRRFQFRRFFKRHRRVIRYSSNLPDGLDDRLYYDGDKLFPMGIVVPSGIDPNTHVALENLPLLAKAATLRKKLDSLSPRTVSLSSKVVTSSSPISCDGQQFPYPISSISPSFIPPSSSSSGLSFFSVPPSKASDGSNSLVITPASDQPLLEEPLHYSIYDYCAMGHLILLVVMYIVFWYVVGFIWLLVAVLASPDAREYLQSNKTNVYWFAVFTVVAAFNNGGMTLTPFGLLPFRNHPHILILVALEILAGHILFPMFLRLIIEFLKTLATPRKKKQSNDGNTSPLPLPSSSSLSSSSPSSHTHPTSRFGYYRPLYHFLMKRGRSCYTHLFGSEQTRSLWIFLAFFIIAEFTPMVFIDRENVDGETTEASHALLNNTHTLSPMVVVVGGEKGKNGNDRGGDKSDTLDLLSSSSSPSSSSSSSSLRSSSLFTRIILCLMFTINTRACGFEVLDTHKLNQGTLWIVTAAMFFGPYPFIFALRDSEQKVSEESEDDITSQPSSNEEKKKKDEQAERGRDERGEMVGRGGGGDDDVGDSTSNTSGSVPSVSVSNTTTSIRLPVAITPCSSFADDVTSEDTQSVESCHDTDMGGSVRQRVSYGMFELEDIDKRGRRRGVGEKEEEEKKNLMRKPLLEKHGRRRRKKKKVEGSKKEKENVQMEKKESERREKVKKEEREEEEEKEKEKELFNVTSLPERTALIRWKNAWRYIVKFAKAQQDSHEARDLWWLLVTMFFISWIENEKVQGGRFTEFSVVFDVCSAYGNVGLTLGVASMRREEKGEIPLALVSKLIFIVVMFLGKHREIPPSLDSAIDFRRFLKIPVEFDRLIDRRTRLGMLGLNLPQAKIKMKSPNKSTSTVEPNEILVDLSSETNQNKFIN